MSIFFFPIHSPVLSILPAVFFGVCFLASNGEAKTKFIHIMTSLSWLGWGILEWTLLDGPGTGNGPWIRIDLLLVIPWIYFLTSVSLFLVVKRFLFSGDLK